jgi:hypothetical protein
MLEVTLFGCNYLVWSTIFHIQSGTPEEMWQKYDVGGVVIVVVLVVLIVFIYIYILLLLLLLLLFLLILLMRAYSDRFAESPKFRDNMEDGWRAVVSTLRNAVRSCAFYVDYLTSIKFFAATTRNAA